MFPRKWPLVENNDCLGKIVQVFFHRSLNYTGVWPPCCRSRALSQGPYRNHASKCLLKKILFVWKFGYTNYGIIYCSISLLYGAGLMMRNSAKPEYQAAYLCECKKFFRSLGHPTRAV